MKLIRPLIIALLLLAVNGCALRPHASVPLDLNAAQVIGTIDSNAKKIHDFSGTALVKVTHDGKSQNFKLSIKYLRPDRFRILVKGFAGIPVGVINVLSDSLTVYFPSENSYVSTSRDNNALRHLIPGLDFDFTSVFTCSLPSSEELVAYRKSIEYLDGRAILVLARDTVIRRYTIEGRKMNVVAEDAYDGETLLWEKTSAGFRSYDGIMFPRKMSLRNGRGSIDLEYSGCEFNTGLTESDVVFAVPPTAEKLTLPGE